MRVDEPTLDELDHLVAQWVSLAREQRAHDTHVLPEENRTTVRESLAHGIATGGVLVARPAADGAGDPIGFVTFGLSEGGYTMDATRGVVENLYVRPQDRGDGVGRALLAAAEERLVERGADAVALEAMADNGAARRFYEREGYAVHRVVYEKRFRDESDTKDD